MHHLLSENTEISLGHMTIAKVPMPNLFLIGATRSGSTTLSNIIRQHPEIIQTYIKEPMFFCSSRYRKGMAWYAREYFQHYNDERYLMDATTRTFVCKYALDRINSLGTNPKFIAILREPMSRAFSHWQVKNNWREGLVSNNFEMEIQENFRHINKTRFYKEGDMEGYSDPHGDCYFPYMIEGGMYFQNIKRIIDIFGKDSIIVFPMERLNGSQNQLANEIFEFIGLEPACITPKTSLSGKGEKRLYTELLSEYGHTAKMLYDLYSSEVRMLSELLDYDFISEWRYK